MTNGNDARRCQYLAVMLYMRIESKEITVDKCLTYADDTDAWTVNNRLDTVVFFNGTTDSKGSYQGRYGQWPRTMMAYTV